MVNIICLKWGTKYNADYVNRLYRMVKKNLHSPFIFYCCSDDFTGVSSDIQQIPLPTTIEMETYWWKLWIHSNEFPIKGRNIYIDLDTVIQNDIQEIVDFDTGSDLYILKAQWRWMKVTVRREKMTKTNSSIICWDNTKYVDQTFERFISDPELYMLKYPGNDDYFEKEFPQLVKTLPVHWVYCRVWGYDDTDPNRHLRAPDDYVDMWNIPLRIYNMPERMICMFNGIRDNEGIDGRIWQGFEHYWSD